MSPLTIEAALGIIDAQPAVRVALVDAASLRLAAGEHPSSVAIPHRAIEPTPDPAPEPWSAGGGPSPAAPGGPARARPPEPPGPISTGAPAASLSPPAMASTSSRVARPRTW